MEKFSEQPKEFNDYSSLRNSLLQGNISFEQVRDKLFEWDQETSLRDAADKNLIFLRDQKIVDIFSDASEGDQESYKKFLSFTEFHVARRLALNNNQEKSLTHFTEAFELAFISDKSWKSYLEGTLLYIRGLEIPESVINNVDQIRNKEILINFNKRLKERGAPLYEEDYNK